MSDGTETEGKSVNLGSPDCAWRQPGWRKAQRSAHNGNCAEAASGGGVVAVRDTKDRDGTTLVFPAAAWARFTAALAGGGT